MRELEDIQNRIWSAFKPATSRRNDGEEAVALSEWAPLVDIAEDDEEFLITAELPAVRKEDVRVTLENGMLTISGERRFEKEEKGRKYHRMERAYGSFSRMFTLPGGCDPAKVNAEFKDGVLMVHVAKSEAARPKQIEVKVH